jgi:hypothetical protein
MDVETDDNFHGFYLLFRVIEQTHTVIIILSTLPLLVTNGLDGLSTCC